MTDGRHQGVGGAGGGVAPSAGGGPSAGSVPAWRRAGRQRERAVLPLPAYEPLRVLLFALTLISVGRVHQQFGFLTPVRPALLLGIGAVAYALMKPSTLRLTNVTRYWPGKLVIALFLFACVSAPFGLSLGGAAMFVLTSFSKVVAFALLVMIAIRDVRDLKWFVWAYVASCGVLAFLALVVFQLTGTDTGLMRLGNMYMYDANDMGVVLTVGIPLALLAFQTAGKRGRIAAGLILLGIGGAMARSGSRGAFLGVLTVGLALLIVLSNLSLMRRIGFVVVVLAGLVVFAPPGYWDQMDTLTRPTEDYNWDTYYGRKETAERGIGYMFRYPVFGIGIGNFARAEGTISERARAFVDRPGFANEWRAAHNSFVQAGSELGIPGLLLWSAMVFGGIFGLYRLRRRQPPWWRRGPPEERFLYLATTYLPISLAGFAVTSFFVSFAWLDPIYLLMAYTAAVYALTEQKLKGGATGVRSPGPRRRTYGAAAATDARVGAPAARAAGWGSSGRSRRSRD